VPQTVASSWVRAPGRGALASNDRDIALAIVLSAALIVAVQIGAAMNGLSPVLAGRLFDADSYMRLVRVTDLWQSGAWFDTTIARIGPPDGLALHWTRPLDVLLLAGASLASPFLGFETALFWWGAIVSPILMIVALGALVWAAAPLVAPPGRALVAFFFVAQPGNMASFMVGRPDHHALLMLSFILTLGFALRVLARPERRADAIAAGLIGALALWISVESLVVVAVVVAAFALSWILGERRMARALVVYSAALCGGLALALVAERGASGLFAVEIDKISILHLVMAALNGASWWALSAIEARFGQHAGALRRASLAGATAALSLLALWSLFPAFFANPMAPGGDLYLRKHMAKIAEIQPIVDVAAVRRHEWAGSVEGAVFWLGIALPAVPWLVYRLRRGGEAVRRQFLLIAVALVAYVPLTLYQVRWACYAETVLVLPYADLAAALVARLSARFSEPILSVVRPLLVVAMCTWVFVPSVLAGTPQNDRAQAVKLRQSCPVKEFAAALDDPSGLGRGPKVVLALIDFGPELLYRTPHAVLSIPNHRPQPGFAAGYRIMTATDFAVSRRLLAENRVDLVAICSGSAEPWFYDDGQSGDTLYRALSDGAPPAFLRPVPLPDDVGGFRLFAVRSGD